MGKVTTYKRQPILNYQGTVHVYTFHEKVDAQAMRVLLTHEEEQGKQTCYSPAFDLLVQLVRDIGVDAKPKHVLLPYKAALDVKALPQWDCATFNQKMGTHVSRSSYSNWVYGTQGCTYTDDEIDPYVERFKALDFPV